MKGEPVLVHTRQQGAPDRYGKPTYTWAAGVTVNGCAVAPRASQEPADVGRQAVITGLSVYLPAGTQVGPYDRLTVRGDLYEVEGEPGAWDSPYSQWLAGVEVAATRVEG